MENLDPLRQKPDFEQIASFRADITDHGMFLGFTAGCEHVWTSHVEPLMKEREKFKKAIADWNDGEIDALEMIRVFTQSLNQKP